MAIVMRGLARAAQLLALLLGASCSTPAPYVWVDDLPREGGEVSQEYRIGSGDVLAIRVWNQENLSGDRIAVRQDGKISLTFLQDIHVVGLTPRDLAARLQEEFKKVVQNPVVTVTLQERALIAVSILGEVARPGGYELRAGVGLLQAIAAAGGLTEFASRDAIYVLRSATPVASAQRIRFRYSALTAGAVPASRFLLRDGDVILAE